MLNLRNVLSVGVLILYKGDKAPGWVVHCMPDQQEADRSGKMH